MLGEGVEEVAHDSILGGHLGSQKTLDRVMSNFYWPGINNDVTRYCQSCDVCQRTTPKGLVRKVPLGTMPVIETPFTRVALDLVGPLPLSASGYRWIITMIDYATRYPEATPLKGISTTDVSEALVNMFSRVGIPREMLTDRGTQFTSDLMKEISRLLSIRQFTTTPYHAMCNGLIEKFNGTLKKMLKRMAEERPRDWDRYIPALLFAYREVPQESLKFSPFELLYGRTVRGPMSILREIWTGDVDDEETKTTYQYVLELRERLEETCKLAHQELKKARISQKHYYDRKARPRKMEPGEQVLIMLPTDNNKLLMQWKGPYDIINKIGENDYRIDINGHAKTFHANMLKKYIKRHPTVLEGDVICNGSLEIEIVQAAEVTTEECHSQTAEYEEELGEEFMYYTTEAKESWKDVIINSGLDQEKQSQAENLVSEYQDVFTDVPGKTDLSECTIELIDATPIRLRPYPVPYALQKEMKLEVQKMLNMGIIEPSRSEYSSPPVIVRKPDNSCRYCIDFRRLNASTIFDAEPIPNQDVLLGRLGRSKYFTKMDLSKGFWQVPIKEEDRHLTAFQTELGLMQFKFMPFGLVNASAIFCRMARKLLEGLDNVESYIDDIIIHTEDWNTHLEAVKSVLDRLRQHHLTARPTKCELGKQSVNLLGHLVGRGIIQPQNDKIDKILSSGKPKTKKQLRSFLGSVGYYRKFIDQFAAIAKPLTDLTKKREPLLLRWNEEAGKGYELLKRKISEQPILRLPQFDRPFILCTDASQDGIGAVLMQEYDGERFPVVYISKKLKPAETRYATIERECLALVWAVKKLHTYLYGREFILETDHQPLLFLDRSKIDNNRVMRWALVMQMYRYKIRVVKGKDNVMADFLSRCNWSEVRT